MDCSDLIDALRVRRNDLEAPARQRAPVIGSVLAALDGLPGCRLARMSGSGPTCFALFDTADEAKAGAHALAAARPDWWVAAAPVIDA